MTVEIQPSGRLKVANYGLGEFLKDLVPVLSTGEWTIDYSINEGYPTVCAGMFEVELFPVETEDNSTTAPESEEKVDATEKKKPGRPAKT